MIQGNLIVSFIQGSSSPAFERSIVLTDTISSTPAVGGAHIHLKPPLHHMMPPLALGNRLRDKRHERKHRRHEQKQRRKDPYNDSIEGEPTVVAACRAPLLGVRDDIVMEDSRERGEHLEHTVQGIQTLGQRTHLQVVNELGHGERILLMPEHADSLKVAVSAVLEFDTNEVAKFRCGTAEEFECQCRGVVGYTSK